MTKRPLPDRRWWANFKPLQLLSKTEPPLAQLFIDRALVRTTTKPQSMRRWPPTLQLMPVSSSRSTPLVHPPFRTLPQTALSAAAPCTILLAHRQLAARLVARKKESGPPLPFTQKCPLLETSQSWPTRRRPLAGLSPPPNF